MSQLGIIAKEQLGAGHSVDKDKTPVPFRTQTPAAVQGVTPTTPSGAPLTGSQVGKIPSPV